MTDPLGQSQVIPYLVELTKLGHEFYLISFEKKENREQLSFIEAKLKEHRIKWYPLTYHKRPPVLSTVFDLAIMYQKAAQVIRKNKVDFIHSRSYPPSLVAMALKKKKQIPFLFDMRGFWADERVDGNLWPLTHPLFKAIYRYFKQKEKEFLLNADAVVSLTERAKQWIIKEWKHPEEKVPVYVIPCCCDTDLFNLRNEELKIAARSELHLPADAFVLGYVGSIGTWYLLREMMLFFKYLQELKPDAWFLFISRHEHELIRRVADEYQITNLKIISANSSRVANLLNALDASVYFIKPAFSKKASSPVKQAELMAAGIPAITNAGIGDTDMFFADESAGILLHEFSESEYRRVAGILANRKFNPLHIRQKALKHFTLKLGAERYAEVYGYLMSRLNDDISRHA